MAKTESVWNHRVVRRIEKREAGEDEVMYYIHEVHYPEVGAKPEFITTDPIVICGEDVDSLRWTLEKILKALDSPVLNYEDF